MAPLLRLDDAVDVHANVLDHVIQHDDLQASFRNRSLLTKEPHMERHSVAAQRRHEADLPSVGSGS